MTPLNAPEGVRFFVNERRAIIGVEVGDRAWEWTPLQQKWLWWDGVSTTLGWILGNPDFKEISREDAAVLTGINVHLMVDDGL